MPEHALALSELVLINNKRKQLAMDVLENPFVFCCSLLCLVEFFTWSSILLVKLSA